MIGYSMKFQFEPSDITLLNHYYTMYGIGEIKVNAETLESPFFYEALRFLKVKHPIKTSFHLPNNCILDKDHFERLCSQLRRNLNDFQQTNYIVHYSSIPSEKELINKIEVLLNHLPVGSKVLLENEKGISLEDFDRAFSICKNSFFKNRIGICFDIGHALAQHPNSSDIFSIFYTEEKNRYINELHIHNVVNGNDHQRFECDSSNLKLVRSIIHLATYADRYILELKETSPFSKIGLHQYELIEACERK